jgi:hypothetical protein
MTRKIFWGLVFGSMLAAIIFGVLSICSSKNEVKITQPVAIKQVSGQVQPFSKESLEFEISYFQNDLESFVALKNECRKGVNLGKISQEEYNQIVVGYDDEIVFKTAMIKNNKRLIDSINQSEQIAQK